MRDNAAAGSERIGFHIRGKACYQGNSEEPWEGNIAHTTLHGIHIGYGDGLPGCLKIDNFLIWKSWDYGVFGFPTSRVIIQNTVVADSNIGKAPFVWFDRVGSLRRRVNARNVSTYLLPYGGITYFINSFDYPKVCLNSTVLGS